MSKMIRTKLDRNGRLVTQILCQWCGAEMPTVGKACPACNELSLSDEQIRNWGKIPCCNIPVMLSEGECLIRWERLKKEAKEGRRVLPTREQVEEVIRSVLGDKKD